jgi:phenylacetate-CoA ligase
MPYKSWLSKVWRTGRVFVEAMAERRAPYRSIARLREIQDRGVREMIRHAYETVPYYREHMREKRLQPEDFQTAEDLAQLPMVDRGFVKQNNALFRSSQFPDELCTRLDSGSGSTTFWDFDAGLKRLSIAERDRGIWLKLAAPRGPTRQLLLLSDTSSSRKTRKFYDSQVVTPRFLAERFYVDPKLPFDAVAEQIEQFRPDVVFSYGSYLEEFSRYLRNQRQSGGMPKLWVYGADTLTEAWRGIVQREMNCRVIAHYSSTECGRIGFECEEQQGYHLNIDHCHLRTVREDGSNCADGEHGQVVVSNLLNRATVLLNYLQGDLAEFTSRPCECGRTLPRLIRLYGRVSDVVVMADGQKLPVTVLLGALAEQLQAPLQFQIQCLSPGRVLFRVVLSERTDRNAFQQSLLDRFNGVYGDRATAEVRFVSNIPRLPRGKFEIVANPEVSLSE